LSVALSQEAGDQRGTAEALMSLARVAEAQGDLAAALHRYQECLVLLQEIDYLGFLPDCLEGLGAVVARQEVPLQAAELWGTAEALREAIGTPMHPVYRADYEQAVAAARAALGEEAFTAAWTEGRARPLDQAITNVLKTVSPSDTLSWHQPPGGVTAFLPRPPS
jgi:tetratricopeptide (TPR) repeat protein